MPPSIQCRVVIDRNRLEDLFIAGILDLTGFKLDRDEVGMLSLDRLLMLHLRIVEGKTQKQVAMVIPNKYGRKTSVSEVKNKLQRSAGILGGIIEDGFTIKGRAAMYASKH